MFQNSKWDTSFTKSYLSMKDLSVDMNRFCICKGSKDNQWLIVNVNHFITAAILNLKTPDLHHFTSTERWSLHQKLCYKKYVPSISPIQYQWGFLFHDQISV